MRRCYNEIRLRKQDAERDEARECERCGCRDCYERYQEIRYGVDRKPYSDYRMQPLDQLTISPAILQYLPPTAEAIIMDKNAIVTTEEKPITDPVIRVCVDRLKSAEENAKRYDIVVRDTKTSLAGQEKTAKQYHDEAASFRKALKKLGYKFA